MTKSRVRHESQISKQVGVLNIFTAETHLILTSGTGGNYVLTIIMGTGHRRRRHSPVHTIWSYQQSQQLITELLLHRFYKL